jgi:hypothetical protein
VPDTSFDQVQRVRRQVDALRLALQSPSQEEILACLPKLADAVACLQSLENELAAAGPLPRTRDPEIGLQLLSLSNELDIAQRLVIHGSAFCESWGRILGVATGGYGATGKAAPLEPPGSVSVKG